MIGTRERLGPEVPRQPSIVTYFCSRATLCDVFGVEPVTIDKWRLYRGMPFVEIPGDENPAIRFRLRDVLEWAAASGKPVAMSTAKLNALLKEFTDEPRQDTSRLAAAAA